MDMIFDALSRQLSIDLDTPGPYSAPLRAIVNRHGHVIPLTGLEMRLTVTADGAEVFRAEFPRPGASYARTSSDLLEAGMAKWLPDQEIVVTAWLRDTQGVEHTASETFTAPRPTKPYPSWTWPNGGVKWMPPVPYPTDGADYEWDEASGAWVASSPPA